VSCTTKDPGGNNPEVAQMTTPKAGPIVNNAMTPSPSSMAGATMSDVPAVAAPANYQKFTNQMDLGRYLTAQYHIRTANELSSCEVCHR
jgi:hypothetical protein